MMIFRYTHFSSLTGGSNRPFRCLDYECWVLFCMHLWYALCMMFACTALPALCNVYSHFCSLTSIWLFYGQLYLKNVMICQICMQNCMVTLFSNSVYIFSRSKTNNGFFCMQCADWESIATFNVVALLDSRLSINPF